MVEVNLKAMDQPGHVTIDSYFTDISVCVTPFL